MVMMGTEGVVPVTKSTCILACQNIVEGWLTVRTCRALRTVQFYNTLQFQIPDQPLGFALALLAAQQHWVAD